MTVITELSGALPDLAMSAVGFVGWSSGTQTAFERPDPTHGKVDIMPVVAFDVPDVVNVQSIVPQSPVVLENPAIHSPHVVDVLSSIVGAEIYQGPHSRDEMRELARRFHHRVARFEAVAGASYEQLLADPVHQVALSSREKKLLHRAQQMDARLTEAHIDTIAYKQEVALRPQEPTERTPQVLTALHQQGELNAAYYGELGGTTPDGENVLLTAYKPLAPSLKVLDDVQKSIRDGMSPLWLAGMPFAAVIGDKRLPPWKRVVMATTLLATALYACAPVVPNKPSPPIPNGTLPPPGRETTLSAAHETGAMMAQTTQGRAFYEALTAHGVDSTACSPDVLGSLVVEKSLPLETVISLATIATDALANTPEPDHLKAMVCDAVSGANGTETVGFYFSSDRDFTGDGKADILIPSQAKVLLPGQLIDGVPQVVMPFVEGQPPAGSTVLVPSWSASGGEIPAEIRGLMTVEERSIRASLTAQGIDPNSVSIHDVFRGSGDDFRMGSGVTNLAQTIAFYPKFDDNIDGFGWRPDLRPSDRPWHWQSVSLPEGVNGKIEVVFDSHSEAPQFIVVTPDESQMMGWFNNLTGQWLTKDGKELTQTLASTATMTATTPATSESGSNWSTSPDAASSDVTKFFTSASTFEASGSDPKNLGRVVFEKDGQRYYFDVPKPADGSIIDMNGNIVPSTDWQITPQFTYMNPLAKLVLQIANAQGTLEPYGWFDAKNGKWIPRYETDTRFVASDYVPSRISGLALKDYIKIGQKDEVSIVGKVLGVYMERFIPPLYSSVDSITWARVEYPYKGEKRIMHLGLYYKSPNFAWRDQSKMTSVQFETGLSLTGGFGGTEAITDVFTRLSKSPYIQVYLWIMPPEKYAGFKMDPYQMTVAEQDQINLMFVIPGIHGQEEIDKYIATARAMQNGDPIPEGEFDTGYSSMVIVGDSNK